MQQVCERLVLSTFKDFAAAFNQAEVASSNACWPIVTRCRRRAARHWPHYDPAAEWPPCRRPTRQVLHRSAQEGPRRQATGRHRHPAAPHRRPAIELPFKPRAVQTRSYFAPACQGKTKASSNACPLTAWNCL